MADDLDQRQGRLLDHAQPLATPTIARTGAASERWLIADHPTGWRPVEVVSGCVRAVLFLRSSISMKSRWRADSRVRAVSGGNRGL